MTEEEARCPICGRICRADAQFCGYHENAREELERGYKEWSAAMPITWNEYLSQLIEAEETGMWIREMIEFIMSTDDL
ncbi:MAG: hypothetical protein ACTSYX_08365 [Candidatus Thorarchaeota archaeon]